MAVKYLEEGALNFYFYKDCIGASSGTVAYASDYLEMNICWSNQEEPVQQYYFIWDYIII